MGDGNTACTSKIAVGMKACKPVSLVCLPFAGAGASFFNDWVRSATWFNVIAPQLPGREKRFLEPPYNDISLAITGVLPQIVERLEADAQVFIFGHSLGAVLAYELACRLTVMDKYSLAQLIVSGSPGPWTPRTMRATGLSDKEFLDQVREFAGYDHPALNDLEMREMLLPTLRADVEMHENYYPPEGAPLSVPITSIRGTHDELVTKEEAAQWQSATTAPLKSMEIPGGHMYLTDGSKGLFRLIEDIMETTLPTSRVADKEHETCDSPRR